MQARERETKEGGGSKVNSRNTKCDSDSVFMIMIIIMNDTIEDIRNQKHPYWIIKIIKTLCIQQKVPTIEFGWSIVSCPEHIYSYLHLQKPIEENGEIETRGFFSLEFCVLRVCPLFTLSLSFCVGMDFSW